MEKEVLGAEKGEHGVKYSNSSGEATRKVYLVLGSNKDPLGLGVKNLLGPLSKVVCFSVTFGRVGAGEDGQKLDLTNSGLTSAPA
jgi:hypothetical protein